MFCEASLSILLTLGSVHLIGGDFNEFNYGASISTPVTECTTINYGYFYNSFEEDTFYVSGETHHKINEHWNIGVEAGAGTGYTEYNGHPFLGGLTLSYRNIKAIINNQVVGFQWRINWD